MSRYKDSNKYKIYGEDAILAAIWMRHYVIAAQIT